MTNDGRLRYLLFAHGLITMAAGLVLVIAPGLIPGAVGIHLDANANVVVYLLAGAEFGFAVLSFGGSRLTDARALRLIAWSCIAFHGLSGALETYAYFHGAAPVILANVAARVGVVALFFAFSRRLD